MGTGSADHAEDRSRGDDASQTRITTSIAGSFTGQFAAGEGITQIHTSTAATPVSEADLFELRQAVDALKAQVAAQASPEKRAAAVERLDELHEAMTASKPRLSTMEYVRDWFVRNIPTMAGAVTAVVVNPIVGRLVQAGGDAVVADFKRRFG
jgi:hypothetical protein